MLITVSALFFFDKKFTAVFTFEVLYDIMRSKDGNGEEFEYAADRSGLFAQSVSS